MNLKPFFGLDCSATTSEILHSRFIDSRYTKHSKETLMTTFLVYRDERTQALTSYLLARGHSMVDRQM